MTIDSKFNLLKKHQETLDVLLELGQIIRCNGGILKHGEFKVQTIFDEGASIIIATANKKGDCFPTHIHKDAVQYLLCFNGSFVVDFIDEERHRILYEKECVYIPSNTRHRITALSDGAKLIGTCIPIEKVYTLKEKS